MTEEQMQINTRMPKFKKQRLTVGKESFALKNPPSLRKRKKEKCEFKVSQEKQMRFNCQIRKWILYYKVS